MPQSGFQPGNQPTTFMQPWQASFAPGASLANLFAAYPSLGDQTLVANLATAGPMQVFRYGNLTINTAITTTNRNRGIVILCDSLTMGASGSLSMTARGAAGSPKWINQDILIPSTMTLSGQYTTQAAFWAMIAAKGYFLYDPTLFASPQIGFGDVQADYASWPSMGTAIISAAGCGAAAGPQYGALAGNTGGTGSVGGCGGGGSGGGVGSGNSGPGGAARVWGGGSGGGGAYSAALSLGMSLVDQYGGSGGDGCNPGNTGSGAGNPPGTPQGTGSAGGTGTGGVLIVICRGAVNLAAGHVLSANGVAGGGAASGAGGGSGGGSVSLFYSGSLTGSPNLTATGGAGGAGSYSGGAGGAGTTQYKTFSAMSW